MKRHALMDEIIEEIGETVDIIDIIKPIYNFKAHNGCAVSYFSLTVATNQKRGN